MLLFSCYPLITSVFTSRLLAVSYLFYNSLYSENKEKKLEHICKCVPFVSSSTEWEMGVLIASIYCCDRLSKVLVERFITLKSYCILSLSRGQVMPYRFCIKNSFLASAWMFLSISSDPAFKVS